MLDRPPGDRVATSAPTRRPSPARGAVTLSPAPRPPYAGRSWPRADTCLSPSSSLAGLRSSPWERARSEVDGDTRAVRGAASCHDLAPHDLDDDHDRLPTTTTTVAPTTTTLAPADLFAPPPARGRRRPRRARAADRRRRDDDPRPGRRRQWPSASAGPAASRSPTGSSASTRSGMPPVLARPARGAPRRGRAQRRRPPRVPGDAHAPGHHAAGVADHRPRAARRRSWPTYQEAEATLRPPVAVPRRHPPRGDRHRPHPWHVDRRRPGPDAVHARDVGGLRRRRRHQQHPRRDLGRGPLPGRQQRGRRHRQRPVPLQPQRPLRAGREAATPS